MDKKEFRKRLEQLAELKDNKPVRLSTDGRLPKEKVIEVDPLTGEETEVERNIPLENDTLGFKLVKIKQEPRVCELGCGEIVSGQTIEKKLYHDPVKHWRTKCGKCGKHLHPSGEGVLPSGNPINNEYNKWFNQMKVKETDSVKITAISYVRKKKRWTTDSEGNLKYVGDSDEEE